MADYMTLTTSRTTPVDTQALMTQLRSQIAPDVGVIQVNPQMFKFKKAAPWTAAEQTTVQGLLDGAQTLTPQMAAQHAVDSFPIEYRALILALVDEINILRAAVTPALAARTPAQAMTAIRNKAATL